MQVNLTATCLKCVHITIIYVREDMYIKLFTKAHQISCTDPPFCHAVLNLYKGQTSVVLYRPYTAQLALLNPPTKLFEFI